MSVSYESDWLPLTQAAKELGCSVSSLYRMRRTGLLLPAVHWHRSSMGKRAAVQVNVSAARLRLQVFLSS